MPSKFSCVCGVKETLSDSHSPSCHQENERTKDLIVEQKFHRTIIGQKGEKIKEVRDKFPEVAFLLNPSALLFFTHCFVVSMIVISAVSR